MAILLLTGDRGLAGGFNGSAVRRAVEAARAAQVAGLGVRWLVIGRKGAGTSASAASPSSRRGRGSPTGRPTRTPRRSPTGVIELFAAGEVDRV